MKTVQQDSCNLLKKVKFTETSKKFICFSHEGNNCAKPRVENIGHTYYHIPTNALIISFIT
jgi:hypothetical protein